MFAFNLNLRRYTEAEVRHLLDVLRKREAPTRAVRGGAVQVEPMKPMLKGPGTKRLKLIGDELLSNFAFKFNLRRYSVVKRTAGCS